MKVQKRDGRIVEYNADKITAAIKKANVEVDNSQKVSDDLIEEAIGNVEKTDKEVIPVETIQDIIEKTLDCPIKPYVFIFLFHKNLFLQR